MKLSHTLFAASICVALTSAIGCSDGSTGTGSSAGGGSASSSSTSAGENKMLSELVIENKVGVSVAKGSTRPYVLKANYADGSSEDVTKSKDTTWNTDDPKAATVVDGVVTAVGETIKVTITATYKDKKAEDSFAVSP